MLLVAVRAVPSPAYLFCILLFPHLPQFYLFAHIPSLYGLSFLFSHFNDVIPLLRKKGFFCSQRASLFLSPWQPHTRQRSLLTQGFFASSEGQPAPVDAPLHPGTALPLPSPFRIHFPVFSILQRPLILPSPLSLKNKPHFLHWHFIFRLQPSLQVL